MYLYARLLRNINVQPPHRSKCFYKLLSGYLAWGLFGALSIQVYMYLQVFSKDRVWTKILVCTVYAMQGTQAVMITYHGFSVFVHGFGNLDALDRIATLWFSVCIIRGIVAFPIQLFYAWRITIISEKKYAAACISCLSVACLASSIVMGIGAKRRALFNKALPESTFIETGFWEGAAAVCDILIAACMSIYLRCRIPKGELFKETATTVNSIIRLSIETGSITAAGAVIVLITTILPFHRSYYVCTTTIISGLYSTSLLAMLNSRIKSSVSSHSTTWKNFDSHDKIAFGNMSPNGLSMSDHCSSIRK